ncbi:hypothetical protein ACFC1I_05990 [Microbacterium sp. NPDC056044]|uniref:hypothetical protein n=1 Tax=Microbacterium sp. NPDC056044 TaxID=3345690 RepID=UPI0035DE11F7
MNDTSRWNRSRARLLAAVIAAPALLLTACTAGATATSAAQPASSASGTATAVAGWPSAIAAIGHSGLTGYDSGQPQVDARANSWATGDNPAVDSVYQRILAKNPAIEGHATNLAVDGSGVVDLLSQAKALASTTPKPDLIVVQSIDNDMQCDGTDAEHLPVYREGLVEVMEALTEGVPDATVFFVSQWGTVEIYDAAVSQIDPSHVAGTGPCDTVDPATLEVVPEKEAGEQAIVDDYFATIVDVCSAYENCRTDEGAMQSMAIDPEDLTPDLNHLMATGHAKMAAIAWAALYPDT